MPTYEYKFSDFMRDFLQKIVSDTAEGISRRADPSTYSNEDLLEIAMSGMGGGITSIPKFKSTEQAIGFGRKYGKEFAPLMKQRMNIATKGVDKAKAKYMQTKGMEDANEWMRKATQRQFYREALEVMTGKMK